MTVAGNSGLSCDECGRDIVGRIVELKIDGSLARRFCDDRCERRFLVESLRRMRAFARRIHQTTGGKARAIARTALYTDHQP